MMPPGLFLSRLSFWLGSLLALVLLTVILAQIVEDKVKTRAAAVESAAKVGVTLASEIGDTIGNIERILRSLQVARTDAERERMHDRIAMAPQAMPDLLRAILILHADGTIYADSEGGEFIGRNLDWRDYFGFHRDNTGTRLHISGPYAALRDGEPVLVASLRLTDEQGNFAGVAAATIRISGIGKQLGHVRLESGGSITLFTDTGIVMCRHPYDPQFIGRDLSNAPAIARPLDGDSTFEEVAALDGVERLYVSQRIGDYPLHINIAQATANIYRHWEARSITIGLAALLLTLGMLLLGWLHHRQTVRAAAGSAGQPALPAQE